MKSLEIIPEHSEILASVRVGWWRKEWSEEPKIAHGNDIRTGVLTKKLNDHGLFYAQYVTDHACLLLESIPLCEHIEKEIPPNYYTLIWMCKPLKAVNSRKFPNPTDASTYILTFTKSRVYLLVLAFQIRGAIYLGVFSEHQNIVWSKKPYEISKWCWDVGRGSGQTV